MGLALAALEGAKVRDFDGSTYDPELDRKRLGAQLLRVRGLMGDGRWRTLAGISLATGDPPASISARLRDLRKPKFGGWDVLRRRLGDPKRGIWEYRVKKPRRKKTKPQMDLFGDAYALARACRYEVS